MQLLFHPEATRLIKHAGLDASHLPLTVFPDGSHLAEPTNAQLAEKIGLKAHTNKRFFDLHELPGSSAH